MGRINQELLTEFLKRHEIFIPEFPGYVDYVGYYKKNCKKSRKGTNTNSTDEYTLLTGYDANDTEMKIMKEIDYYYMNINVGPRTIKVIKAKELYILLRTRGYSNSLHTELARCFMPGDKKKPAEKGSVLINRSRMLINNINLIEHKYQSMDEEKLRSDVIENLKTTMDNAISESVKTFFESRNANFESMKFIINVMKKSLMNVRQAIQQENKNVICSQYKKYRLLIGNNAEDFINYVSIYADTSDNPEILIEMIKNGISDQGEAVCFYYVPGDDDELECLLKINPSWIDDGPEIDNEPVIIEELLPEGQCSFLVKKLRFLETVIVIRLSNNHLLSFSSTGFTMKQLMNRIENEKSENK